MSERTVKHREDGPPIYIGDVRSRSGDEMAVDEETAEYLVEETGYFEYIEDNADNDTVAPPDEDDVDAFLNDWFAISYNDRAEMIEEGMVDEYLDAIEAETQSQTELDAIEARREELGLESGDE